MQQLYRCWSWWLAHPGKQPVFVYDTNELSNIFVLDFLDVMKNSMGLYISPSLQYHDSMYTDDDVVHSLVKDVVWTKNTGKWLNDIPVTDFAMLDPHKQLRRLFFEHAQVDANAASIFIGNNKVTSNNDDFLLSCLDEDMPRSQRRRPRIAILNRDPTDFRQLLNAHELASMIEAKFPDSAPVPVVEFMDNSHGREQFQFFLSTDILITPHGAQLSGMGLLPHCAQMMEFLPRDYLVADFFGSLAEATGVNHTFFYMDEGNHFDASISNSTTRIRHEERFHHFRNWDYRELHMCPNLAKVMDAVTELVSNWNPCCAAAVATANAAKDNQLLVPYPVQSAESSSNEIRRSTTSALTDDTHPVIDIISVGSIHRLQTLDAQKRTFGSHSWVRNMIFVTEHNDTEANCHVDFSVDKLDKLRQYCAKADNVSKVSRQLRTDLFGPSNHTGWMCAQKRPIDGLQIALEKYKAAKLLGDTSTAALPDYLMIIDDDTYLNINALVSPEFMAAYPPHEKHIVSGCTYMRPASLQFIFSVGGVGTFLSRGLVERLMKPIRCEKKFGLDGKSFEDAFTRWACWRLDQNHIGEKYFFQEGMSVGDLMYAYTSGLSLTEVESWKHDAGYCLHSDHTTGYFFSFYHLSVPEELLQSIDIPTDTMRKRFPFVKLFGLDGGPLDHSGRGGQCDNLRQICTPESRICHYTEPALMNRVFAQTQKRQRQLNNNPSSSNVDWIWITVSGPTLCSIFAIAWLVLRRKKTKRKI